MAALSRGEEKDRIERMASTGLDHKFKRATMEDVTFASLELKLGSGHPYVYCHQGCCEHRLAFHDLRAVHTDDRSLRSEYPRTIYHKFERRVKVRLTHKSTHTHSFSDFRVPPADSFHSSSKFFVLVFRLPPLPSLVHGMRVRRGKVHRVLGRQSTLLSLRHVRGLPPEPPPGHEGEGAVRRLPNVPLPDRGSQGDMREDDVYTRKNPLFFVWFCEFFCFGYSSRRGMEVALHGPRPRRVHDLVHEEEEDGPTQPLEQTPQVALGPIRERLFPRRTITSPGSPRCAASATTAPSSCSSSPTSASAIYIWSPLHVPSPSPRAPLVLPPAHQRLQFRPIRHALRPLWTSLISQP